VYSSLNINTVFINWNIEGKSIKKKKYCINGYSLQNDFPARAIWLPENGPILTGFAHEVSDEGLAPL